MLKMILKDGTTLPYTEAVEAEEYWNGASRRTLTLTAAADAASLDALTAALTEENLATLTLVNDDAAAPATNVYNGYVLVLACGVQSVQIAAQTADTEAAFASRLVLKLGKHTYIEAQLARLGVA